ncbi:nucleotidyltransferase substrate binding protein [uncultured Clostridium sp.]|uniref:nucleotidyltransferase substrate binding protein n=1 Tax=uncultured Clostridium sp. TaxID=59620 RepID=UPI0025DC3CB5|nr:nucleotidyltransferase substrate binding protein [uncultured Clostridium sp.]
MIKFYISVGYNIRYKYYLKEIRWKQRFENFEKTYKLLEKYSEQTITNELEKAGIIQFFEMAFELAWKVLKDYLESEGYIW